MLIYYIKIALRNLFRSKVFTLINILGLSVGMGVCLLIFQYIHFELSYDQFHPDVKNIYRVTTTQYRSGEDLGTGVFTPYSLGVSAKKNIPEVIDFVRIRPQDVEVVLKNPEKNEPYLEGNICYVDDNFLKNFDFPLKYGNKETALEGKNSMVITEAMAIKYFGESNPIGKPLKVSAGSLSGDFIITGVLAPFPINSHLQFDFLMPLTFILEEWRFYREVDSKGWELPEFVTYVRLDEAADPQQVVKKLEDLTLSHMGGQLSKLNSRLKIEFQRLTDIHLRSSFPRDPAKNRGDIQNIHFFSIIALFILLMAWINYVNLSTAQAIKRSKEVGVRKSLGANRQQLISQFITESALINFAAALLSFGIAFLMLPVLNHIIGKELQFDLLQLPEFWGYFFGAIVLGAFISGVYPAFVLSSFKPVSVFNSTKIPLQGGFNMRKAMIVFQFLISALLISGTYLVYNQIHFMKNHELGMDMDKILIVIGPRVFLETLKDGEQEDVKYKVFKNELGANPAVSGISCTSSVPSRGYLYTEGIRRATEETDSNREANILVVDTDFADTYNLEFLAKIPFNKDIDPNEKTIINEEAVKAFGLGTPEEALHHMLVNNFEDTLEVVAVVKNFHWSSLKDPQSPQLYILDNSYGLYFSIKLGTDNVKKSIADIKNVYHAVFPHDPFDSYFLDDDFNRQYQADLQFGNLFSAFSILAIFIACLGLFALVSYSASLRVKEIGIRKVLGAGVGNLMMQLSREYMILLLIAHMVAVPLILYWGRAWLDNYAFRVGISIDLFLIPALILFIISLLTVSYRTYASARANPIQSLRKE